MKTDNKFTKGRTEAVVFADVICVKESSLKDKHGVWAYADRVCTMGSYSEQAKANAELFAEALNVANRTGMTPEMMEGLIKEMAEKLKHIQSNMLNGTLNITQELRSINNIASVLKKAEPFTNTLSPSKR